MEGLGWVGMEGLSGKWNGRVRWELGMAGLVGLRMEGSDGGLEWRVGWGSEWKD